MAPVQWLRIALSLPLREFSFSRLQARCIACTVSSHVLGVISMPLTSSSILSSAEVQCSEDRYFDLTSSSVLSSAEDSDSLPLTPRRSILPRRVRSHDDRSSNFVSLWRFYPRHVHRFRVTGLCGYGNHEEWNAHSLSRYGYGNSECYDRKSTVAVLAHRDFVTR